MNLLRRFFYVATIGLFGFLDLSLMAGEDEGLWDKRIIRLKDQVKISMAALADELASAQIVVLGETHNHKGVQMAEAEIIRGVVDAASAASDFSVGWEFLDWTLQGEITKSFTQFKLKKISGSDFLEQARLGRKNRTYISVLDAVREKGGDLVALNLSRGQKAPLTVGGLKAIDPRFIPPDYEQGDAGYLERFRESMGGHASEKLLENYYEAQCMTDDTMAYSLALAPRRKIHFVIAGGFHVEHFSGVVARLQKRFGPSTKILTLRIDDASQAEAHEWEETLKPHEKYGVLADYFYFSGEPKRLKKSP